MSHLESMKWRVCASMKCINETHRSCHSQKRYGPYSASLKLMRRRRHAMHGKIIVLCGVWQNSSRARALKSFVTIRSAHRAAYNL